LPSSLFSVAINLALLQLQLFEGEVTVVNKDWNGTGFASDTALIYNTVPNVTFNLKFRMLFE
jgi:hypothetical protein